MQTQPPTPSAHLHQPTNSEQAQRGTPVQILLVAALYALLAWVGVWLCGMHGKPTLICLETGFAISAVIIGGPRFAWAVLLGELLVSLATGNLLGVAAARAVGEALAALGGGWLVNRHLKFDPAILSFRFLLHLFTGSYFAGVLSSVVGSTSLLLSGAVLPADFALTAVRWWMSDAVGILLVVPLCLMWWPTVQAAPHRPPRRYLLELGLVLGVTTLSAGFVFQEWWHSLAPVALHPWFDVLSQGYWMFLYVLWASVRLGNRGTSMAPR